MNNSEGSAKIAAARTDAADRRVAHARAAWVVIFLLAIAVPVGFFEHGLRQVDNSYSKKRRLLEERAAELEVLITGPSGALYGIDPAHLQGNALNVADVSQSLHYDEEIVHRYLPKLVRLRLVIFPIGLFSMESNLSDTPEYWREFWYQQFWQLPSERNDRQLDLRRFSLIALYPPGIRLAAVRRNFVYDLVPTIDDNGWNHFETAPDTVTEENALVRVRYHAKIMRRELLARNEADLGKTLAELRERGVASALVVLPVHHFYASHFDQEARVRERAALERLSERYGAIVRDYSDDHRFSASEFYDTDHLNTRGAQLISRILDEEIVRPVLSGSSQVDLPTNR